MDMYEARQNKEKVSRRIMTHRKAQNTIQCLIDPANLDINNFIKSKAFINSSDNNINACGSAFTEHNGRTSGGGTKYKIDNRTVFHHSVGKRQKDDGCTIFFYCTQPLPNGASTFDASSLNTGAIVGVGQHINNDSYDLSWSDKNLFDYKKISL